jgi:hypothetical protein
MSTIVTSEPDANALTSEVERLRTEVRALRVLLHGQTSLRSPSLASSISPSSTSGGITTSGNVSFSLDGPETPAIVTNISASEIQAMKAIFDVFDEDRDGLISVSDLAKLYVFKTHTHNASADKVFLSRATLTLPPYPLSPHRHAKLGEPITDDEAREAVNIVGSGNGTISFTDLARYWDGSHPALAKGYVEDGIRPEALNVERERRRNWYRARFKFVRAKIPNAAVGRVFCEAEGPCPSLEYRLRFYYNDPVEGKVPISPWHDVPLRNGDGTFNMIVEIPKWTRKKFEIATGEVRSDKLMPMI